MTFRSQSPVITIQATFEVTPTVKHQLSKESCAEQFRVIAARLDLASGYSDARVVQGEEGAQVEQAGRLLEQATRQGLIELPQSLDGWLEELEKGDDHSWRDNTAFIRSKLGPNPDEEFPFSLWLLNPHVRFLACVVDRWLSHEFPAQLRTQSRGVGSIDTRNLDGESYVAFWRSRLQTFADACRVLSDLISNALARTSADGPPTESGWPPGEWRTAIWYRKTTSDLLLPGAMLQAGNRTLIKRHRLREGEDWRYETSSVISNWPEHRVRIEAKLKQELKTNF